MVQPVGCAVTQTFVLLPELGYVTINPLQQVGVGVGVAVRATVEVVEVMVVKIIVPLLAAGFKHASVLVELRRKKKSLLGKFHFIELVYLYFLR